MNEILVNRKQHTKHVVLKNLKDPANVNDKRAWEKEKD